MTGFYCIGKITVSLNLSLLHLLTNISILACSESSGLRGGNHVL